MEMNKEHSNQQKNTTEKWYDEIALVDMLLFLLPPVGVYALYKSKRLNPNRNKVIAGLAIFAGVLWFVWFLISNANAN